MYAISGLICSQNKRPGEKSAGQRISRQGINFASSYIPGLSALLAGEWHRREKIPSPRRDVLGSRHLAIWTEGAKEVENAQSGAQSDTSLVWNASNELGSLGPVAAIPFSAIK